MGDNMETLNELIERLNLIPHWVEKSCRKAKPNSNGTIFVLVSKNVYTTFQHENYAKDCKVENSEIIEVRP